MKKPRVSFAFFSDAHKIGATGKLDCFGIFDTLRVWAVPATREFSIIAGFENLPEGETTFEVLLRGKRPERKVGTMIVLAKQSVANVIAGERIKLTIRDIGQQEIGIKVADGRAARVLWLPLMVSKLPWPVLPSGEELKRILLDPRSIKAARAEFLCAKCDFKHLLEIQLDPDKPLSRGTSSFPADGKLKCGKCKTIQYVRDIEGQLLSHLGKPMGDAT